MSIPGFNIGGQAGLGGGLSDEQRQQQQMVKMVRWKVSSLCITPPCPVIAATTGSSEIQELGMRRSISFALASMITIYLGCEWTFDDFRLIMEFSGIIDASCHGELSEQDGDLGRDGFCAWWHVWAVHVECELAACLHLNCLCSNSMFCASGGDSPNLCDSAF